MIRNWAALCLLVVTTAGAFAQTEKPRGDIELPPVVDRKWREAPPPQPGGADANWIYIPTVAKAALVKMIRTKAKEPVSGAMQNKMVRFSQLTSASFSGPPANEVLASFDESEYQQGSTIGKLVRSYVESYRLSDQSVTRRMDLPLHTKVLAYSLDGSQFVGERPHEVGDGRPYNEHRIDLWQLGKNPAESKHLAGIRVRDEERKEDIHVGFIRFTPAGNLITEYLGRTIVWKLPDFQPIWKLDRSSMISSISPDHKYFVTGNTDDFVQIINIDAGKIVATFPNDENLPAFAWHASGSRLLTYSSGRFIVRDMTKAGLPVVQDIGLTPEDQKDTAGSSMIDKVEWIDDRFFMWGNRYIYDLETGTCVAECNHDYVFRANVDPSGAIWFRTGVGDSIFPVPLMDPAVKTPLLKAIAADPPTQLVKRGMKVAIQMVLPAQFPAGTRAKVEERVKASIQSAGLKYVDNEGEAALLYNVSITPGQASAGQFGEGAFRDKNVQSVTIPSWECRLSLKTKSDAMLWTKATSVGGNTPQTISVGPGQTLQQKVDDYVANQYQKFLEKIPSLPNQIAKMPRRSGTNRDGKPTVGYGVITLGTPSPKAVSWKN